ncbi:hypothetical protein CCP1ISM_7080001 [Azospirillaceae bacterium]
MDPVANSASGAVLGASGAAAIQQVGIDLFKKNVVAERALIDATMGQAVRNGGYVTASRGSLLNAVV